MPWFCKCHPAERDHLLAAPFPRSGFSADAELAPEDKDDALFQLYSTRAGVWAEAEEAERPDRLGRERSRSPTPEPEEEAWPRLQCANMNSKHVLRCTVATCAVRRPLVQQWREGDYYCKDCGNHCYGSSLWCQLVHCHSNDWT